jgi:hypothetical protein
MWRLAFESMRVRANKFREVEGGGTTWYASRTEAVGLGRVVPSSSTDFTFCFDSSFLLSLRQFPSDVLGVGIAVSYPQQRAHLRLYFPGAEANASFSRK